MPEKSCTDCYGTDLMKCAACARNPKGVENDPVEKTMPDIKEKLVELIHHCTSCEECFDTDIADHLIANGVTIQQNQFREVTKMVTNADRIRAMSDEELMAGLYLLYRLTMEQDGGDIARHWCDGKSGCTNEYGEIECNEERHKACILRWLQQPAEEAP